jgi:fatty-acyl-CoA synthase
VAVAVVAQPDDKWGESPCAFVELVDGSTVKAEELAAFCKARLASLKHLKGLSLANCPKHQQEKSEKKNCAKPPCDWQ